MRTRPMRPFNPTEVTKYLLWVVLALVLALILGWYVFQSHGHNGIHSNREGAVARLRVPESPNPPATVL
jgi:hypothetical protein